MSDEIEIDLVWTNLCASAICRCLAATRATPVQALCALIALMQASEP